jgi:hypothetical protein
MRVLQTPSLPSVRVSFVLVDTLYSCTFTAGHGGKHVWSVCVGPVGSPNHQIIVGSINDACVLLCGG